MNLCIFSNLKIRFTYKYTLYSVKNHPMLLCHKKGEKVSTPLDKDGRGLHDLYDTYGQVPLTLRDSYIF